MGGGGGDPEPAPAGPREVRALLLDVDGTLAETERHGHLAASNATFRELDLPVEWSWEDFLDLYPIPGNARRLRHWLQTRTDWPDPRIQEAVEAFRERKQEIYIRDFLPGLELRPGVRRLLREAVARDLRLAVVSTSHERQIHALLDQLLPEYRNDVEAVYGKETAVKTGPEGRLYAVALARLGLRPFQAVAIEDSPEGAEAAVRVGIPTAVFYTDMTASAGFPGARLVARSLDLFDLDGLLEACTGRS